MKVLVEAMCAEFGGIRTYAENLLAEWPLRYPGDEVHVLVAEGSSLPIPESLTRHEVRVRRPSVVGRPLAQTRHLRRLARQLRPDAVLATLPSTTLTRPGCPTAVVVYDLRHELRPAQFSRSRRLLRAVSYARGYAVADGIISISQRSLDDLHRLHPGTRTLPAVVAHLGADHVESWPAPTGPGPAVTFAHHTNKNLDLVLAGWERVLAEDPLAPDLLVLGLGGERQAAVAEAIDGRGLTGRVRLAPFLPEAEFQAVMAAAAVVVFPSDFEGFGLPVVEGMTLGIPVVIGPEPATTEVAGGHAQVMRGWTAEALAGAVAAALASGPEARAAATAHGRTFTWRATTESTRGLLAQLAGTSPRPGG